MKEKLKNIGAWFKNRSSAQKVGGGSVRPTRDWVALVSVVALLLVAVAAAGAYEFFYKNHVAEGENASATQYVDFEHGAWDEVVAAYRIRSDAFETLRDAPGEYPLPSNRAPEVLELEEVTGEDGEEELVDDDGEVSEEVAPVLDS